ncbi:MAG: hypothetical protein EXR62_01690 [Chloroflexi bacterium]|nr:hypothetical protein [Chloroflexota bacterium]
METKGKANEDRQVRPEGHETGSTISRRRFLKSLALVAGGAVVTSIAAACGATPTPSAPAAAATTAPAAQATTAPAAPTKPAAAAATTAPAAGSPKSGGKLVWALESDPVNLIPYGGVSTSNQWGKEFIYDSLVEWDKDLKVQPALAEKWETPDDKTWIWHLRKGVKYHDGNEVTADDVKYSIELQANPPAPGIKVGFYPKVDNVEVVDKYTAKFNMKSSDPTVLGYLGWARYSAIIPKGLYDKVNVLTTGIGTGPFKLVEYTGNDHVLLTKNVTTQPPDID